RAVASLYLTGTAIGPRRWHGTRRDDPNDTIPHEHRRDLRGMRVFAAWLGHDDSRAINSLDVLQDEPSPHVRHYLIDFGSTLGSASSGPNSPRSGHVPFFSWKQSMQEFFTFGLYVPSWSMARYPAYRSVGRIEHERFAPERWVPEYPNPAFENMLPDDAFWAAKQVANFTDEEIRTVVRTGQISDADAEAWLVDCLIRRRDKISRAFFHPVLPLDRFRVENDTLMFEDVGEKVLGPARYTIRWAGDETGPRLPAQPRQGGVLTANIEATDGRSVSVDLIGDRGKARVVGITRTWRPGKNAKHVKLVGTR
ncbi:MAG TPA: hypothetical protein VEQ63_11295, partial [Bryobacteraceae bacterium]|nr:hypothetical protein [Bryobacteraceae bacterium]